MSLLPETVPAEVLAIQRVSIHGQKYVHLVYRTERGEAVERVGLEAVPPNIQVGERVLLHRQLNMTVKVTRPESP